MPNSTVHLVCNSHIDPVWLWEWPEGAAVALATFRTAADLCEEFAGFVFNHNEALLYKWIEEYDPGLFRQLQKLVRAGQWHIMGGWYLQPDCNMPSGESLVRQILIGRRYFQEKFGARPSTAANLDPFGHTRGLVQILAKSGYDSYLFCRPSLQDCGLPGTDFTWVGYGGTKIHATWAAAHYNSPPGGAADKARQWLDKQADRPCSLLLWGVGDHGGGPSREDLRALAALKRQARQINIIHSTPERYFQELRARSADLPHHARDLNPWAVGCYTSMARMKQKHRQLENELYLTEKMATTAAAARLMPYPQAELHAATYDLLTSEFHDALPGTSIPPVEEATVQLLDHGLETLARVKTRAFFALATGQPAATKGTFPILVHNPHPYRVAATIECELQPPWPHQPALYAIPQVFRRGRPVPAQAEKEHCNINEDHRKRVVFSAVLEPSQMNRFDCRLKKLRRRPPPTLRVTRGVLRFRTRELDVAINTRTGLLDRYRIHGVDFVRNGACRPLVMKDNADPWGMTVRRFRDPAGRFRLMSHAGGSRVSGITGRAIPSVRVIEDGPVRVVIEAVLAYGDSFICQRYKLPRRGTEIEIELRVHWNEKDRMLKLALPTPLTDAAYLGQVAYGVAELPDNGDEAVAQKWVALVSRSHRRPALTCINAGTYGSDMTRGELRLSLLRSPAHAGHPTGPGRSIVRPDRYTPRMDQGERVFRFWLNGGPAGQRLQHVDREALVHNERPMALSYFPSGAGKSPRPGPTLSDPVVQVAAFKPAEAGDDLIIRLFEPTGRARTTTLSLPFAATRTKVRLAGFEIKTLRFDRAARRVTEVNLLEEWVGA
jgi:alpha-mannosidase